MQAQSEDFLQSEHSLSSTKKEALLPTGAHLAGCMGLSGGYKPNANLLSEAAKCKTPGNHACQMVWLG